MRDKYIKIFEEELENSRAVIGDSEKAVINALEDASAWLGISRADREVVKPYTDAIMDDAFNGTLKVIYNHANSIMVLPAEKDAATEHKIETMLYQALKYGACVFYRTSKWSVRDRMYVLQMSGGKIIPLSGREARAAYKSKICEGLARLKLFELAVITYKDLDAAILMIKDGLSLTQIVRYLHTELLDTWRLSNEIGCPLNLSEEEKEQVRMAEEAERARNSFRIKFRDDEE